MHKNRRGTVVGLVLLLFILLLSVWSLRVRKTAATSAPVPVDSTQPLAPSVLAKTLIPEMAEPVVRVDQEIARIIHENHAPGRIVFLHFRFEGETVTLYRAVGTPGRVMLFPSPGPTPGHLAAAFLDSAGSQLVLVELEDPLNRFMEWEDETTPGKLRSKIVVAAVGETFLRIPGEVNPSRIMIYRSAPENIGQRRLIASFLIP